MAPSCVGPSESWIAKWHWPGTESTDVADDADQVSNQGAPRGAGQSTVDHGFKKGGK